jgi:hypothetical protein
VLAVSRHSIAHDWSSQGTRTARSEQSSHASGFGEFLKLKSRQRDVDSDRAYRCINSKRADFVIIDAKGYAVVVVEYQGYGHYQGTAAQRDAVKREVWRSGALIEVIPDFNKA